jgi:hypothetical protein
LASGGFERLLNMQRNRVNEVYVEALGSQPGGVDPRPTPTSRTTAGGVGRSRTMIS